MASIYVRGTIPNNKGVVALRYKKVPRVAGRRPEWATKPPFYVRYTSSGRQAWSQPYQTLEDAQKAAETIGAGLQAEAQGLTVAEMRDKTNVGRIPITRAVEIFMEQKRAKNESTLANYRFILNEFISTLPAAIRFVDQIDSDQSVLDGYMKSLESKGAAPRTIRNKVSVVCFMLKKRRNFQAGIETPTKIVELPTIDVEDAVPYSEDELQKLFAVMDADESVIFRFFLDSAGREQEVATAEWGDINFQKGTFHIHPKKWATKAGVSKKFTVKAHRDRFVPLGRELLDLLKARKVARLANARWIFPNADGTPDGHLLRKFKSIAKSAGLNCGECSSTLSEGRFSKRQIAVTCAKRPVCEKHYLHRLRKTAATFWHSIDIPLRNIQYYLGHRSLDTTQRYLGIKDSADLRDRLNRPKF